MKLQQTLLSQRKMWCTHNKKRFNTNLSSVWQKHPQFRKVIHLCMFSLNFYCGYEYLPCGYKYVNVWGNQVRLILEKVKHYHKINKLPTKCDRYIPLALETLIHQNMLSQVKSCVVKSLGNVCSGKCLFWLYCLQVSLVYKTVPQISF